MPNPFRFGQVVSGELFCNRKSEIRQVANDLAGGQSIVLYSPRRYGKTSLLVAVAEALKTEKILCGYVDFFACNTTEKILVALTRAVAKAIVDDLKSIEKFMQRTSQFFKRIGFSVRLEPNGSGAFSISPELSSRTTTMDSLTDALSGLNGYLEKDQRRAALVLDEFQQIIRVEPNFEAEFRTVIQQQDRIAFAFLGSRTHLMNDMFINKNRPFYHAAKIMALGPIEADELATFIRRRFKKINITVASKLAKEIAERVSMHPDYAQRLCSHVVDILESNTVNEDHVKQGVNRMLVSLTPSFRGVFEELPLRESQVMTILAERGPIGIFTNDIIRHYDMGTPSLHKALSNLVKKDLVQKNSQKKYDIVDPFLAEWIRMVSRDNGWFPA